MDFTFLPLSLHSERRKTDPLEPRRKSVPVGGGRPILALAGPLPPTPVFPAGRKVLKGSSFARNLDRTTDWLPTDGTTCGRPT